MSFNSNGGTFVTAQSVESGKTAVEPKSPTRDGYEFSAWYNGSAVFDFETPITSNITLTAHWSANVEADKFVIAYENTRGAENTNPTSYRGIEGATLSDLTLTGYNFEGWYDSKDENGNGTGTKIMGWNAGEKSGNITLYAKWSPRAGTAYTVEHWLENADDDDSTLFESENMTGTTDAQTKAEAKSYEGFTAKDFEQIQL